MACLKQPYGIPKEHITITAFNIQSVLKKWIPQDVVSYNTIVTTQKTQTTEHVVIEVGGGELCELTT